MKYFIVIDGSQKGPFSIEELKEKNIRKNTLVWADEFPDWVEAALVEELKEVINIQPPPIPKDKNTPKKGEPEIKKVQDNLISTKTEVKVAKETKSVFHLMLYALVIGIFSFPIFYFGVYQAAKYDNVNVSQHLNPEDFPFPLRYGSSNEYMIKIRKDYYMEDSIGNSSITFVIAAGALILIRYISKTAKWVQETSKKQV